MEHPRSVLIAIATITLASTHGVAAGSQQAADPAKLEYFEKKVRPLLVENCYNCHSASTNAKGGLRVDDRNGLLAGGGRGAAIVPGEPDKSLLIKAVDQSDKGLQMPPKKHLSAEQIDVLSTWIKDGAAWPTPTVDVSLINGKPNSKFEQLRKEHWAWQPLTTPAVPQVADAAWAKDDVDRFVLLKLESKNLKPAGDADRVTLIRRVTFDLTGLPPKPEDVQAFVDDRSEGAFAKVIDRLLASPQFGERWGRHWLDVARYAESTGSSRNIPYPHAWRYRDYVIDAFNADKPYDQFLREQIAGDLLPAKSQDERDEHRVATGFLALGVKDVNQRFKVRFEMDNVDEQIDTVSRSTLALTASCARCHDHKFDPVTQADYYALAGIFHSTDLAAGVRNKMGGGGLDYYDPSMLIALGDESQAALAPDEKVESLKKEAEEARKAFQAVRGKPEGLAKGADGFPKQRALRMKAEALQKELMTLTDPATRGVPVALGARDSKTVGDTELRIRGEAEQLGPQVPRGFLSVVSYDGQPKVNPQQSGRLELAQWLSSEKNPLTSRVFVNRVWHHLFGNGIVKSVDNFGVTGDAPTHPELLDHLAGRFVKDGWSVKRLIRSIVLTRTYQLGAEEVAANAAVDPANELLWRHAPRRLDAEEIRDATLVASGRLDGRRPQGSPTKALPYTEQRNNGPEAARFATLARDSAHRSVYLPLLRGWTPTSLAVFDFAEQGMVTGSRDVTTVSPQALYLLNDPFVREQAKALAERVLTRSDLSDVGRIDWAYRLTVGRAPTQDESQRASAFIAEYESTARDVLAEQPKAPAAFEEVAVAVTNASNPADAADNAGGSAGGSPAADTDADAPAAKPAAGKEKAAPAAGKKANAKGNNRKAQAAAAAAAAAANGDPNAASGAGDAKQPPQPVNPDEVLFTDETTKDAAGPVTSDPKVAAWASFTQALIGSAEFRYVK